MIKQLFLLFLLFFFPVLKAQQIYSKDYGKKQDPFRKILPKNQYELLFPASFSFHKKREENKS